MANFSSYNGSQAPYIADLIVSPTKAQMIELGAAYVERANDNAGTFVCRADGYEIGYVPNSHHTANGEWLYYSSDVAEWLDLAV